MGRSKERCAAIGGPSNGVVPVAAALCFLGDHVERFWSRVLKMFGSTYDTAPQKAVYLSSCGSILCVRERNVAVHEPPGSIIKVVNLLSLRWHLPPTRLKTGPPCLGQKGQAGHHCRISSASGCYESRGWCRIYLGASPTGASRASARCPAE